MSETTTAPFLTCPVCGGRTFSWIIRQVQFGTIHSTDEGQYVVDGSKMGEMVDDDIDKHGVFCRECEEDRPADDLVVLEAADVTDRRPDTW